MANLRILLIDDEVDLLEVIGARIKSWGYELFTASNGREGIEILKSKQPDIVILDYIMPDMDGVSILKEIRKIDKDLPVIMFTAHPDMKVQQDIKYLGVSAFIPKLSAYSETQASLKTALGMIEKKLGGGARKWIRKKYCL